MSQPIAKSDNAQFNNLDGVYGQLMGSQLNESIQKKESVVVSGDTLDILAGEGLQSQDSFGRWMNYIMTDSPGPVLDSSISSGHQQYTVPEHVFSITDVSPAWAFSAEKTKVSIQFANFLC